MMLALLPRDMEQDPSSENHVCEICGEEFDSEADLDEHLYSVGIVH